MDDPSFLAGRSSYAKKRRAKRMNVCKCGAILHNKPDCRSKTISAHKIDRLEFVKRGRVTLWGETPVYKTWVRWCEAEYGISSHDSDDSDVE
uniref:Putative RNA binding protein n=1 Tax=Grapevine virus D TaxID=51617 RepID=A0A1D8X842_9VIRU|nr:putative RNA binding protein [Grapevine virus D]